MKRKLLLGAVTVVAVLVTFMLGFNLAEAATTVPGPPVSADSFPVIGAAGVMWEAPSANLDSPPDTYVVDRRRPNGQWEDVSGPIDASVHHWIDTTLEPGESHEYAIRAVNEVGTSGGSTIVTAGRPLQDPVPGRFNVLTVDANLPFNGPSPLTDEVATSVTVGSPQGGTRTLSAGTIQITLPTLMRGGFSIPGTRTQFRLRQGETECGPPTNGSLTITELAYTSDLGIALMSGWFWFSGCGGSNGTYYGEIRVNSTEPYSAISLSSSSVDFGQVRVGTGAEREITLTNAGTTDLTIEKTYLSEGNPAWWAVQNDCSAPLLPAGSCTMTISFKPTMTPQVDAWVRINDSTHRGNRFIKVVGAGKSTPAAPDSVDALATFTGVDLSWTGPADDGARPVQSFVVRRYFDNKTSEYRLPADRHQWIDPDLTPGARYSVSAVNELGEGQQSEVTEPMPLREQIAVFRGPTGEAATLGALAVWGGTQLVPMSPDAPTSTTAELAVSPNGQILAYTTAEGDNQVLWTRQIDGSGSHPADRVLTAPAIHSPAWSPDGTRIAYTTADGTAPCVDVITATGGAPVRVGCSLEFPVWHPDAQTLIVRDSRISGAPLARVAARAAGARIAVLAGANGATHISASPDGRLLAFVPAGQPSRIGFIPMTGGATQLSPEIPASSVLQVSWRQDPSYVAVLSRQSGVDRIHAVPLPGSSPDTPRLLLQANPGETIHNLAWQGLGPMITPMPAVTGPSPSIAFDTSAVRSGATTTCQVDERTPVSCTSPYRPSGLTSGPHIVRVIAQELGPSVFVREAVATRGFTVDATPPSSVRIVGPTFGATVAASATVTYTATDPSGVASYDVRYRRASSSAAFGSYVYPKTRTTATSYVLPLAAGYEYCVSVRASDALGNMSAWAPERCFSRPLDDRALTAGTGWTRGTAAGLYYGTGTWTTKYNALLTRSVKMKRGYVLATRCPTCGVVAIYLGTRYLTSINLYATTTQRQVLIGLPVQTSPISGTLRLATRSTGKLVQIDGLAIRQT